MQKVNGSNPFSRFACKPAPVGAGFFSRGRDHVPWLLGRPVSAKFEWLSLS